MRKRGLQLLEAHMRSLDPDVPTARERLEAELGEPLARALVCRLSSAVGRQAGPEEPNGGAGGA